MRKLSVAAIVFLSLMMTPSAQAHFCATDPVPAATLLAPWVAVEMNGAVPDPNGTTTYLTITNVAREATLIHVTVWDVMGQPRLGLTEVLSGYDTWSINFRDLLTGDWQVFDTSRDPQAYPNKDLPWLTRTPFEWGPDGRNPQYPGFTGTYPLGLPVAHKTTAVPGDGCQMPYGSLIGPIAAPTLRELLQAPLFARVHNGCIGPGTQNQEVYRHTMDWLSGLSANPIIFSVTVDAVDVCSVLSPADSGYWNGVASNRNVLMGNVYYVNDRRHYSESIPAVSIEASATEGDGVLGFYQSRFDVEDHREPLPTALAFPYQNDPGIVTSDVMLWKSFTELYTNDAVLDCGAYMYYAWDQDEHSLSRAVYCPTSPCYIMDIDPNLFPFQTQMVPLTIDNFDLPDKYGWMLVVFPPSYGTFTDLTPGFIDNYTKYMAWAAFRTYYQSHSTLTPATVMANAHCNAAEVLPSLGRTGQ